MRPGKYRIKDLGRKHFSGIVEVVNEAELIDKCREHLRSAIVRIRWLDPSETKGDVVVGFFGGRKTGEVEYVS